MTMIQLCPVCRGSGLVAPGFYDPSPYPLHTSSSIPMRELCRSCSGRGTIAGPSITDTAHVTGYGVRSCRDHWHVTHNDEDMAIPGDPFPDIQSALDAADKLNREEGQQ